MRDKTLQIIRAVSMLIIVMYHCMCYYGLWDQFSPGHVENPYNEVFYSVSRLALMVFVFISGYLYGQSGLKPRQKTRKEQLKSKVSRLLIPYCIWGLIALLLFSNKNIIEGFLVGPQHVWFLLMLFIVFLISIVFKLNKANNYVLIAISIACIVAAELMPKSEVSLLTWRSVVRYMPSFLIGVLFAKNPISEKLRQLSSLKFGALYGCSFLMVLVCGVFRATLMGAVCLYMAFLWWVYLTYIFISRFNNPQKPIHPVINSLDKHSMSIYLIHHLLLWGIFIYIPQVCIFLDMHTVAGPILLFAVVLTVSWALSWLLNSNKYTRMLFDFKTDTLRRATNKK